MDSNNCKNCVHFGFESSGFVCKNCVDNPKRRYTGKDRVFYRLYDKAKLLLKEKLVTFERLTLDDQEYKIQTALTTVKDISKFDFFLYFEKEQEPYQYEVNEIGTNNGFIWLKLKLEI